MGAKRTQLVALAWVVSILAPGSCDRDASKSGPGAGDALPEGQPTDAPVSDSSRPAISAAETTSAERGRAFLAQNGKRAGVMTTASGLQYEVLAAGHGATPGPTDRVTTHYHGTLLDGRVFDSSMARGEPIDFPVNGVIRGWTEALQLMQVGDRWKLYVPSELAYGGRGAGAVIGPDETLIFEVELLAVQ